MDQPLIRRARPSDARAIAQLHTASWKTFYRGVLPDEMLAALTVKESEARHTRSLEAPDSSQIRAWVLEREGRVIGWATTGPARDEDLGSDSHELHAIYLRPSSVGHGHGRVLMQHCLDDVAARGFREMVMWVLEGNERAQRFYAAAGFVPDVRVAQVDFRDTGAMKLRMVRLLAQD